MKKEDFKLFTRFRVKGQQAVYQVSTNCILEVETGRVYSYFRLMDRGNRVKFWIGRYLFGKMLIPELIMNLDDLELVSSVDDVNDIIY